MGWIARQRALRLLQMESLSTIDSWRRTRIFIHAVIAFLVQIMGHLRDLRIVRMWKQELWWGIHFFMERRSMMKLYYPAVRTQLPKSPQSEWMSNNLKKKASNSTSTPSPLNTMIARFAILWKDFTKCTPWRARMRYWVRLWLGVRPVIWSRRWPMRWCTKLACRRWVRACTLIQLTLRCSDKWPTPTPNRSLPPARKEFWKRYLNGDLEHGICRINKSSFSRCKDVDLNQNVWNYRD